MALREMVSELMGVPLDFSKPLWHMHVIDNYRGARSSSPASITALPTARGRVLSSQTIGGCETVTRCCVPPPTFRLPLEWLPAAVGRGVARGQADRRSSKGGRFREWGHGLPVGAHGGAPIGSRDRLQRQAGRQKRAAWSEPVPLEDFN
jgi:hypothetical protein